MVKGIEVAQTDLPDTALQDKTFSSRALSPKDRIENDGSITTNGSGVATAVIQHSLPYPPVHLFFFNPGNTNAAAHPGTIGSWVDAMKSTDWGLMDNFTFTAYAEALKITIRIAGLANKTYKYHYFIFSEPAAGTTQ